MKIFIIGIVAIYSLLLMQVASLKIPSLLHKVTIELLSAKEMQTFLKQNPNAVKLEREAVNVPLNSSDGGNAQARVVNDDTHYIFAYMLGERNGYDRLIGYNEEEHDFVYPSDILATYAYPPGGGTGPHIITFCRILVDQSNDSGRAYIIYGGIGQKRIKIGIEVYQTKWFAHSASFYGYLP